MQAYLCAYTGISFCECVCVNIYIYIHTHTHSLTYNDHTKLKEFLDFFFFSCKNYLQE